MFITDLKIDEWTQIGPDVMVKVEHQDRGDKGGPRIRLILHTRNGARPPIARRGRDVCLGQTGPDRHPDRIPPAFVDEQIPAR